jgi:hypothetical protein
VTPGDSAPPWDGEPPVTLIDVRREAGTAARKAVDAALEAHALAWDLGKVRVVAREEAALAVAAGRAHGHQAPAASASGRDEVADLARELYQQFRDGQGLTPWAALSGAEKFRWRRIATRALSSFTAERHQMRAELADRETEALSATDQLLMELGRLVYEGKGTLPGSSRAATGRSVSEVVAQLDFETFGEVSRDSR